MIIVDIETTGLSPQLHSIVSLGAVDYDTGDEFYRECGIPLDAGIDPAAMAVNGFTEVEVRDVTKPCRAELYAQFLAWSQGRESLIGGQGVGGFDIPFLKVVCAISDQPWVFGHRAVDLHSIAYIKLGKSLSLDGILMTLGLAPEPKPHNALTGARLERDAFKLLLTPSTVS